MVIKYFHDRCTHILYNRLLGYPLNEEDTGFLMSIFPLHPRFSEKIAGRKIECIIIKNHEKYHNRCFTLVFSDGSYEYISFLKCIQRISKLRDDIKEACKNIIPEASCDLIEDWIRTFRYHDTSLYSYINYPEKIFNNPNIINNFQQFVINKTQTKGVKSLISEGKTLNISENK